MNYFLVFSFLIAFLALNSYALPFEDEITSFEEFKRVFGKTYSSDAEEASRRANFEATLREIEETEAQSGIDLGVNAYADLAAEEFASMFRPEPPFPRERSQTRTPELTLSSASSLPENFDWRSRIQFNPIENQGSCGSCWAFAACTTVEAAYAHQLDIHNLHLSRQELVDCTDGEYAPNYQSEGCKSGYPSDAYKYMARSGVFTNAVYPYQDKLDPACYADSLRRKHPSAVKYHISNYGWLKYNDTDQAIMEALRKYGPGTVDINGTNRVWRNYRSGIMRNVLPHTTKLNHIVTLVGWGTEEVRGEKIDYWILRNSWGQRWGEGGYGRLERGKNNLGINSYYNYPILK